jgi:hypothetical protein
VKSQTRIVADEQSAKNLSALASGAPAQEDGERASMPSWGAHLPGSERYRLFWTVDLSFPVRQVEKCNGEKNRSVVVPCKKLASQ